VEELFTVTEDSPGGAAHVTLNTADSINELRGEYGYDPLEE
jgi:hypothetical protein